MASIFTITAAAEGVTGNPGGSSQHRFTVTNATATRLTVGVRALAEDATFERWLAVADRAERELAPGATDQVTVTVQVPADASPGKRRFRLLVFSAARPDEDFTEGPQVVVEVQAARAAPPAEEPARPFPWWIAVVAALVLLIGAGVTTWFLLSKKAVEVPRVVDLSAEEAVATLQAAKLAYTSEMRETREKAAGTVLEQNPAAGTSVDRGSSVTLVVASAPSQEPGVSVPTVVRLSFEDARREIEQAGLQVQRMDPPLATREFQAGQVTSQIPPGKSSAKRGDTVRLKVAGDSVEVPSVVGQPLQTAIATLVKGKLVVTEILGNQENLGARVTRTTPGAGELVLAGTPVKLQMPEGSAPGPQMEQATDRPGQDYRSFDLSSPDPALCQGACASEARCKAWTYVKPGVQGATARCWLKDTAPPATRNDCCVSGVQTAPTGLPAPRLLSPANGSSFNVFPRRTELRWQAVAGAASYTVEVDCMQCCAAGKWCTDVGQTFRIADGAKDTRYTFDFVGAQPGRWRVWAVDASGRPGPKSDWWEFRYTQ